MATAEERLMQWLRDAHAAEEQAETMLTGMAARLQNYPKLKARIKKHITETKRQARLVRGCIKRRENGLPNGLEMLMPWKSRPKRC